MNGWTAAQLANLLGGEWRHSPASHWRGVHFSINRAHMTPNTVFIAIDPDTWVRGTGNSGLYTEWTDGHETGMTGGCFDNAQSCVESVKNRLEDGDYILIKGSRRGCDFGEIRNLLQRGIEEGL